MLEIVTERDHGLVGVEFSMDAAKCHGRRGYTGLKDCYAGAVEGVAAEVELGEVGSGEGVTELGGEGFETEDVGDGEAGEDV